MEYGVKDNIKY